MEDRVGRYPPELRERAVRMVAEVRPSYRSQWAAITAAAEKLGVGTGWFGVELAFRQLVRGHCLGQAKAGGGGRAIVMIAWASW